MPSTQPVLWAVLVVAGCAAFSAALILILRPLFIRHLLAEPNARSSHIVPTPQGAGLAVMASVVLAVSWLEGLVPWMQDSEPILAPTIAAAIGLTIIGLFDDAFTLSVPSRLIGQVIAATIVVWTLQESFKLFPGVMPEAIERVLIVVGIIWFINAVNFLDGLDWMTVAQTVPMTLGIVVLEAIGALPPSIGLLALALLGATLGFALFNKHPASIFLGDAGSLPIGLLLAFMLIFVAKANLVAAVLLSLYTLADATLTLFRRILAGERIDTPHRWHFYQRAVAEGLTVPQVTARVFALELVLAALAIATVLAGSLAIDALCLALGLLAAGLALFALGRGS
jgi:UDP-N-acetylmuramyl pentapeptide phosphotransferase/UDP-N-acetylglucosamine-1-phosphate transferase